ncbi:putative ring domain protein [Gregarina niphandrodes]|uniref:Ring domain protein n=1 Tax=Gregarina niphandrodes TaxID=110365 RepID=A0A023BAY6_GRENI|nr:putative ring domain protein [Gregarina niphandrodes]EZG78554.1 putative ring domain protein [Gregarina niphandrodes]|eukprot:XP_011129260.1 putative ring domain protein [Gregarina niphandrodes]
MYVCHACRRRTQAVHTGPNELACVRCGIVGFVEELDPQEAESPRMRRTVSEQEREEAARYANPFTLLSALMRDIPMESSPDSFLQFLPDAMTRITRDNLHNLVYYILAQQQGSDGPPPAARSVLESLPKEVLTPERAKAGEECAICQDEFKAGEEVTHMSRDRSLCPHFFHTRCIVPWLERVSETLSM